MPGETFITICGCTAAPGTVAPSIAPYVVSLNGLYGIVTLAGTGAIELTSLNNVITIGLSAAAGLGSVTSVALASGNSNLTIADSPITTNGTITLDLAGNLDSISGLVMAADQMLYSTGAATFTTTSLTAFARTLLDDAAAVNARSTLGLVIGTDVQAFSQDLSDFVTNAVWTGANLALAGNLQAVNITGTGNGQFGQTDFTGDVSIVGDLNVSAGVTAATFSGNGAALTALNGSQVTTGTVDETVGGTGNTTYVAGDLLQGTAANTLSKLASVAAGSFLRSGGVTTASAWSTLVLPNAATVGDIFSSSTTNTMSRITAVATGNALISGGVATLPTWGKITSSHVNNTIPTISAGVNGDISSFSIPVTFVDSVTFSSQISVLGALFDASSSEGTSGQILTSTVTGTAWSNQIFLDTLRIDGLLSSEATITAAGVTGAQTINKMTGTVRFAAAASTLIITNSLAVAASTRALATVCTNDTTLKSVCAVVTDGFITLTANAAATAETEVFWELRGLT